MEKFIKAGGSFGLGTWFSIGGEYKKDEKYMNFTLTNEGFKIFDSEKTIRLIGSRVIRFNWNSEYYQSYFEDVSTEELITQFSAL